MRAQGRARTDVGLVRSGNEDDYLADSALGVFAVCDGVGGHAAGEVASAMTIITIERSLTEQRDAIARAKLEPDGANDLADVVANALRHACNEVYARASSDPELAGMGSTATVLVVAGERAVMAHVGDTRLYLLRNRAAHQLSFDHTLAAELVRQGKLAPDQERGHPQSHVLTRAIGPQPSVDVETLVFDLDPGDRLILCSDGLADHIPSTDWLAEKVADTNLEDVPDELVEYALACGGHDNITVLAVDVDPEDDLVAPSDGADGRRRASGPRTQQLLSVIGDSYLFSGLSLAQLTRVLGQARIESHQPGDVVRSFGTVLDEILVVVEGALRIERPGRDAAVLAAGQQLGEGLVLRPRPINATITAEGTATLLTLDAAGLIELASSRPWLGIDLLTRLVVQLSGELDRVPDAYRNGSGPLPPHFLL